MSNIRGLFSLDVCGKERELKCDFNVVDKLERQIFKRPIMLVLTEAVRGQTFFGDVVDTIHAGLEANGGTSLKRNDIGAYVHSKGLDKYIEWYIKYLTYAITGEEEPEIDETAEDDKKK